MKASLTTLIWVFVVFLGTSTTKINHGNEGGIHSENNSKKIYSKEYIIVVRKNCPKRTLEAITDFQDYIVKITGEFPQIVNDKPSGKFKTIFWIGSHAQLSKIFPKKKLNLGQEEIFLMSDGLNVLILGDDKEELGTGSATIRNRQLDDLQFSYGTINAIYTFLYEKLNVRWFWPDELGEDFISMDKLIFSPFEFRFEPPFKARSGLFYLSGLGRNYPENNLDQWCKRSRLFYSSEYFEPGHAFSHWWETYSETRPNLFALTEKGNRKPIGNGNTAKLCISNPEISKLWLKDVQSVMLANPFVTNFNGNENDGFIYGWCHCEDCRKIDDTPRDLELKRLSDRHVFLVNQFASELRKKYPSNKNFHILYFDYGYDRPLPKKYTLDSSVWTVSVSNFHLNRSNDLNSKQPSVEEYLGWSKISSAIYWRPNLGNPVGLQWGLPDIAMSEAFEDFAFVAKNKCRGVSFDGFPNHWSTQGPQYYVVAQLAWNPYAKKDVLLNDYYTRCYGPARSEMREYWEFLESIRAKHIKKYGSKSGRFSVGETYTPEVFQKLYILLDKAKKRTKGKSLVKYNKRIKFVESGMRFTYLMITIRREMESYEKTKNRESYQKIKSNWEEIVRLKKQMDPIAINFNFIKPWVPEAKSEYKRRMKGMVVELPVSVKERIELDMEAPNDQE